MNFNNSNLETNKTEDIKTPETKIKEGVGFTFEQKSQLTHTENIELVNKDFLSHEKSLEIVDYLFNKYKDEMRKNLNKDVDGWGNGGSYQRSNQYYFRRIPEKILEHYWGHGITRGDERDRLASLLCISANKSIRGTIAGFSSQMSPYTNAEFIVISQKDKEMDIREIKPGTDYTVPVLDIDGSMKIKNLGAISIDVKYYPMYEELKKMFPDVNIIKANELNKYFGVEE